MARETVTWRYLPHWYMPGAAFFVTYRVANSLPQVALERLKAKRELLIQSRPADGVSPGEHRLRAHKLWFAEYDALLDEQPATVDLSERSIAALLRENLYHHHGKKYYLLAYCIMPNHVHVVLQPIEDRREEDTRGPRVQRGEGHVGEREDGRSPLAKIMHGLKSYTAHAANQLLDRTGSFWQRESYDHWIRDNDELDRIVAYIQANPQRANLVARAQDWAPSSCHDRYRADGEVSAWLRWES